ncbi:MAG TPA: hypothetical protein VFH78_15030 [Candidatus Thermoplasmatota archaeon]|nr:hypothetical protein [Candidatus Thermoplasmatota archaeon]
MGDEALALGLAGFAAAASVLVVATADGWPLLACGVALPLATLAASAASRG